MKHTITPAKHWVLPDRPRHGPRRMAVVLVAVLALAACGGEEAATDPDAAGGVDLATVPDPQPVGVADPAELPEASGPADNSCDPRASLAPPDGPLPPPGDMPAGTKMAEIAQRGRLIVGLDQNTYLFGYLNPESGQLEGFDVDIAKQIAKAIIGDENAIQPVVMTSADRIPALQERTVDVVVRTMTANCDRWQDINFSTIYYEAGQRVLVKQGSGYGSINDLGGQKICAAAGSTSIRNISEAGSGPVPVSVSDWSDCLVMLQQNQVQAVSTDDTILSGLAAQDPNVELVGPPFTEEPYGIGINKEDTDLVRFVNQTLEQIRADGTWASIHQEWLGAAGQETPEPPAAVYRE